MTETTESNSPKFRLSVLFWLGLILLVAGGSPLLSIILLASMGLTNDPNPNPVGLGILAMLTFWPGIVLIVVGLRKSLRRYRAARESFQAK